MYKILMTDIFQHYNTFVGKKIIYLKNKYNRPWKRTLPSLDLYRIRLTAFVEKS